MLHFTRNETTVLLFLIFSFIVGIGIRAYRYYLAPLPKFEDAPVVPESVRLSDETRIQQNDDSGAAVEPRVCINDAGKEDLERLPGIGPVLAERIIAYRSKHGKFSTLESLMAVKGIGRKTFEKLKPYLNLQ